MMPATIDDLLSVFFDELQQTSNRYSSLVRQAEEAGQPQLAKLFRAIVASELARGRLFRSRLASYASHVYETQAYYVCPDCGLIFVPEAPDKCPVDDMLGAQFERIS
jgi:rubrerythrin